MQLDYGVDYDMDGNMVLSVVKSISFEIRFTGFQHWLCLLLVI